MIHERKLDKQLHINGPLTTCVATVTASSTRSKPRSRFRMKVLKT